MGVGAFATPQFEQGKKKESIKSMNTLLLHRLLPITYRYIKFTEFFEFMFGLLSRGVTPSPRTNLKE